MPRQPKVAFAATVRIAFSMLLAAAAATAGSPAYAASMDITPDRLYLEPPGLPGGTSCQSIAANPEQVLHPPFPAGASPAQIQYACLPNNVAWANLMSELGMALAPAMLRPARTTGYGGFELSFEATYTHINADAVDSTGTQYWHQGTQGTVDPNTHQFSTQNRSPDSFLQVYALKARKGLPFGFEIAGVLGTVANTSLWVIGGDVRWAVFEGYRSDAWKYVPDLSIGGAVRTVAGSSTYYLTTVALDAELSKPIPLADSAVLTPYVGAQRVIIFADSASVDLTPNVDPAAQCGSLGSNVPGNQNAHMPYDGSTICANKLSNGAPNNGDYNNDRTFNQARIHRWRGLVGIDYRYELIDLAAEFATDLTDPSDENANLGISGDRQWTISLKTGVSF